MFKEVRGLKVLLTIHVSLPFFVGLVLSGTKSVHAFSFSFQTLLLLLFFFFNFQPRLSSGSLFSSVSPASPCSSYSHPPHFL